MISQAKKSDRMKIGIFDSGFGGLSVLHEAYHRLGATEYLFFMQILIMFLMVLRLRTRSKIMQGTSQDSL